MIIVRCSTLSCPRLKMQQDIQILKQKCNAAMIAPCPGQVWWSPLRKLAFAIATFSIVIIIIIIRPTDDSREVFCFASIFYLFDNHT